MRPRSLSLPAVVSSSFPRASSNESRITHGIIRSLLGYLPPAIRDETATTPTTTECPHLCSVAYKFRRAPSGNSIDRRHRHSLNINSPCRISRTLHQVTPSPSPIMPGMGMDISEQGRSVALNDHQFLKAHRALPRKRDFVLDPSPPNVQVRGVVDHASDPVSNGIVYPGPPSLPLTPPSLPTESGPDNSLSNSQDTQKEHALDDTANATPTPTPQLHPLTPDVTPPRTLALRRKREEQNQLHPSMSSRADSFTTAREALSSDEEAERRNATNSSSLPVPKQRSPHPLRNSNNNNTLTGDNRTFSGANGSSNSRPNHNINAEKTDPHLFDSFDGQWDDLQRSSHGKRAAVKNKSPDNQIKVTSSSRHDGRVRQKVQDTRNTDTKPAIQKFAADIGWLDSDEVDGDSKRQSWRLSGTSTTSTVEAMVIDPPPQKRRTLRRTGKAESLRTASAPVRQLHRHIKSSSATVESERRLTHKPARLSNEDRRSVSSDMSLTNSVTSDRPKQKEEVIPVVVIPQRRSSLRNSAQNSTNHSRAQSMHSARRPTTAPDGATGAFDVSRKRRTMSESFPHVAPGNSKNGSRRNTATGPPRIPPRRSSLSAPTSANNSRAASMTSNTPTLQPPVDTAPPPTTTTKQPEPRKEPEPSETVEITVGLGDPAPPPVIRFAETNAPDSHKAPQDDVMRYQSPLAPPLTPFQASIKSMSPGPVEISEARAVPFFSHNNESILVVERHPQAGARANGPPNTSTLRSNARPAQEPETLEAALNSPLRNPRSPPMPPPLASGEYNGGESATGAEDGGALVRGWGSLRRALSGRRQTDTLSTAHPVHHVRNPKAGRDIDSNKQSFWHPRAFWDDVKESDTDGNNNNNSSHTSEPADEEQHRGDINPNTFIGNSLGIPQNKAIFQGPLSLIRRVSNRARSRSTRQMNLSHVSLASSMLSSRRSRRNRRHVIPGLGLRLPLLSLGDTQRWLSRIRRRREEEKLEARRGKLKQKIGAKVPINDDDRLILSSGNGAV